MNSQAKDFYVVVGATKLSSGGVKYIVDVNKPHPGYKPLEANDIALVRTAKVIQFNDLSFESEGWCLLWR